MEPGQARLSVEEIERRKIGRGEKAQPGQSGKVRPGQALLRIPKQRDDRLFGKNALSGRQKPGKEEA
jgi:transposase-like protein